MKVYFLSGLGADKRVFQFLNLSFCEPVFIDWIKPFKNESLEAYALRLKEKIAEPDAVVVGVSFGGMLATEMAKKYAGIKPIIISSNKTYLEFPKYLSVWKNMRFYKLLPHHFVHSVTQKCSWLFTAKGKEKMEVFKTILNSTDIAFNYWAIDAIFNWKNTYVPPNLVHIHGTADRLLPYRYVSCDYTIRDGTHLMVMNNNEEISLLLKQLITSYYKGVTPKPGSPERLTAPKL